MAFWKKILQKEEKAAEKPAEKKRTAEATASVETSSKPLAPIHAADRFFAPLMTEKTSNAAARGQYVFAVSEGVNKPSIARAVSRRFGVTVVSVRMLHRPGKERRRGRIIGWKPGFKKAMVMIKKGQKIDLQ